MARHNDEHHMMQSNTNTNSTANAHAYANAFTYAFKRHCVLCNRTNTLDPLYVCTGMKCIQKDASINQKCQHYLHCTSIITALIIASSFVNETRAISVSVAHTSNDCFVSVYGLLKGWWIRICSGRFIVFCVTFICCKQSTQLTHAYKMPISSNTVTINIIALQWNVYLFNEITGNSLRTKKIKVFLLFYEHLTSF